MNPDRQCTATSKQSRERCKRAAIPGGTVCAMHGGKSPGAQAAAAENLAQQEAERLLNRELAIAYGDKVPDVDPAEAMLQLVSWKHAEVIALRAQVASLDEKAMIWGKTRSKTGGEDYGTTREAKPNVWWAMLRQAEDQLVRFAAAARAANADERRVVMAEKTGIMLASAIGAILRALLSHLEGVFVDDQAALRDAWESAVADIVPAQLRALAAGEEPAA